MIIGNREKEAQIVNGGIDIMSKKGKIIYGKEFYNGQMDWSMESAQIVIPYILEKLQHANIRSCVDFGCGVGTWLFAIKSHVKTSDVLGLDFGEPAKEQLKINPEEYRKADLSEPIILDKMYDLCISLEVAEHIDQTRADVFIDNLTKASDIILFSAALPGQGGTGHVNEQRLSYWVEKFSRRGFELYDIIRPYFWNNEAIKAHYRQNMVLFCKNGKNVIDAVNARNLPVDIAHPEVLANECNNTIKSLFLKNLVRNHNKTYELLRKIKHFFIP